MDSSFRIWIKPLAAVSMIGVCVLATGCLPEPLEVTRIPAVKPEIVVSSQIIPDETLLVLLTRTLGALDASNDSDPQDLLNQIAISGAQVTVEGPAGVYALDSIGTGLYGGVEIPFAEGETYTLKVTTANLGSVEATATVVPQVQFSSVDAQLFYDAFDDTLAQITYSLQDPITPNYYMINVQEVERQDFVANLINPRAFTVLTDDKAFNGNAFGETFRVFPRDYKPGDTIAVSLSNVSKEYYDFVKLRLDNRFSFVEFLGEPVNYPSNVKGGKGFFNLYLPDVRFFVFDN